MHYFWQNWLKLAYKIDRDLEMHFEGNLRAIAGFSIPKDSKKDIARLKKLHLSQDTNRWFQVGITVLLAFAAIAKIWSGYASNKAEGWDYEVFTGDVSTVNSKIEDMATGKWEVLTVAMTETQYSETIQVMVVMKKPKKL